MKCSKLFILISAIACMLFAGQSMTIQVKTGQLRDSPSFLGKIVVTLSYGDRVELLKKSGGWCQVRSAKGAGWIHNTALSRKSASMTAGKELAQTDASGDELALAGKGFNSDVEAEFKARNKNIDFTAVDAMDAMEVTPEEMTEFLKEGKLSALP